MTKLFLGLVFFIVILTGALAFVPQEDVVINQEGVEPLYAATYLCDEYASIYAGFSEEVVTLALSDGREVMLAHKSIASSTRYTNDTGMVFSTKNYGAMFEENGTTTYAHCVLLVEEKDGLMKSMPTNFAHTGVVGVAAKGEGLFQDELIFAYQQGTTTRMHDLIIDELSVCASSSGATPCLAMSAPFSVVFGDQRAHIEGVEEGGKVVVRKLRILAEGEEVHSPALGDVFIAWAHTAQFIERCEVTQVMQTHALDVYFTLKTGGRLRAVEPVIDEVFRALETSSCPDIVVATE
jgi:hypothetical protein